MPLIAGNLIAVHRVSAELTRGFIGQPPMFGRVVAAGATGWEILWADGKRTADISGAALDRISSGGQLSVYFGKVVELDINSAAAFSPSGAFDATVCSVYTRDQNGDNSPTDQIVLCKLLNADVYIETLLANATILDNR